MAGPTRLELATSGVTGQRSDQLNYDPAQGCAYRRTKVVFEHTPSVEAGATRSGRGPQPARRRETGKAPMRGTAGDP